MATKYASREVCNLTICDYNTGKPLLYCDYANTTTTEMTSDSVYAYGGYNHVKRVAFNGNREATMTVETQMQSFQLYSLITGATIESSATFIKREVLASVAGVITLTNTPIAGTVNVFASEDDCGTVLPSTVNVNQKTVTVTGATGNDSYIVYYQTQLTDGVSKLNVKSTTFPSDVQIFAETLLKTEDGQTLPYDMIVYKATPQAQLTLEQTNDGDPATLSITFDILATPDNNMLDLILIEDNA